MNQTARQTMGYFTERIHRWRGDLHLTEDAGFLVIVRHFYHKRHGLH
jgi:hypothetical protein